jgi:hypothetical protein
MPDVAIAELDAAQNAIIVSGTTYYLSLHTADPGATGASESSEGRKAITFGASSNGTQTSTNAQNWASAVGGSYTNFGLWTAASGGTYLRGGALTPPISPTSGSAINFATGEFTLTAA